MTQRERGHPGVSLRQRLTLRDLQRFQSYEVRRGDQEYFLTRDTTTNASIAHAVRQLDRTDVKAGRPLKRAWCRPTAILPVRNSTFGYLPLVAVFSVHTCYALVVLLVPNGVRCQSMLDCDLAGSPTDFCHRYAVLVDVDCADPFIVRPSGDPNEHPADIRFRRSDPGDLHSGHPV